jgi:hypothetical protein
MTENSPRTTRKRMKSKALNLATLALLPAVLFTLTSCSSTPLPPPDQASANLAYTEGVPGGLAVATRRLIANVTAIDTANRKVTILTADGQKTTVKCGPEVINFDQIRVGDQLKVLVTEELAVSMATDGGPVSDGGAAIVALAPKGAKPGGVIATTVQVSATVTGINLKRHRTTLQFPDGTTHTVAVRKDVDLTQRKVGEKVVIRTTEAMALSMEKIPSGG